MNTEELVAQVDIFRSLDKRHLGHLARSAKLERYGPGEVIISQGDVGQVLHIIVSGSVEVRRERAGQTPVVLNTLRSGQFFGEMALLDDYPRSATIVALEETTCLTLWKWHFLIALEAHPDIAVAMLPPLAHRLRQIVQQLDAQV